MKILIYYIDSEFIESASVQQYRQIISDRIITKNRIDQLLLQPQISPKVTHYWYIACK
jgi:hypothetical protein